MNTDTAVYVAIQEYLAAREAGRPIDRAELVARHPHVAQPLTRCLDALEFVQGLTGDGPAPGTPFGEFVLLEEIGRGGMGVVYEAEQPALGRRVALKVLPGAAALDGRQRQRFLNEARAAAGLHHPHIVPVHAVGEANGTPYFAMQKIDGKPLTGKHDPKEAARLIVQAADALAYAHAQGVIHRDVKPGNLLVEPSGHVWVVDFGLARVEGVAALSATADVLGTPRYMSPEQASGAPLEHRTDQFSLALTLYEAATGRPAYDGTSREAVLRQVLAAEPPAPDVPRDLRTILTTALARDPAGRYPGCREFADDLRRYLDGRPIVARREGLGRRVGRWAWRMRALLATGVLALLIGLTAAVGVLLVKNAEVSAAERRAKKGKSDAEEALALEQVARYRLSVGLAWREWQESNTPLARQYLADCPEAERGWEWHHLHRLFNSEVAVIRDAGRAGRSSLAFSPDGLRFAVVLTEGVGIHDAVTGRREAEVPLPGATPTQAVFVTNRLLAVCCQAGGGPPSLHLVDTSQGRQRSLDVSPLADGQTRVSVLAHAGRVIAFTPLRMLVWERTDGPPRRLDRGGIGWRPTADHDRIIGVVARTTVQTLNVVTGGLELLTAATYPVSQFAMTPDGKVLATIDARGWLGLTDATAGKKPRYGTDLLTRAGFVREGPVVAQPETAVGLRFCPDGKHVIVGWQRSGQAMLVRTSDGRPVHRFLGHSGRLVAAELSPDGSRLVTLDAGGEARLWSTTDLVPPATHQRLPIVRLAFSGDGAQVAAFSVVGGEVVDRATHRPCFRASFDKREGLPLRCSVWFRAGRVHCVTSDGQSRTYDPSTGQLADERACPGGLGEVSPDGRYVAAVKDGALGLWPVGGGEAAWAEPAPEGCDGVAFSPDGRSLATWVTRPPQIVIRQAQTGAVVGRTGALADERDQVSFSPDGRWLAASLAQGAVELRRSEGLAVRFTLAGRADGRKVLAFSPGGLLLAVGRARQDGNGAVILIDVEAGRELLTLPTGVGVTALAFSPDGGCLAVGLGNGRLLLWEGGPRPSVPE